MLTNSIPWKEELLKSAKRLEGRLTQSRWTERTAFLVERDVMVGAYAVRKLLEAPGRVSDPVKKIRVRVLSHPLVADRAPDWWAALNWWELYDMDSSLEERIPLRDFCNHLIHSFVFAFEPTPEDDGLAGFYVNSEYHSKKALLFVATETLVELFRTVGADEVIGLETRVDGKGLRYVARAYSQHEAHLLDLSRFDTEIAQTD